MLRGAASFRAPCSAAGAGDKARPTATLGFLGASASAEEEGPLLLLTGALVALPATEAFAAAVGALLAAPSFWRLPSDGEPRMALTFCFPILALLQRKVIRRGTQRGEDREKQADRKLRVAMSRKG